MFFLFGSSLSNFSFSSFWDGQKSIPILLAPTYQLNEDPEQAFKLVEINTASFAHTLLFLMTVGYIKLVCVIENCVLNEVFPLHSF